MITPEEAEELRQYRPRPDSRLETLLDVATPPLVGLLGGVALDQILNFTAGPDVMNSKWVAMGLGALPGIAHLLLRPGYKLPER